MAASVWKGTISFGLVSVPIKLFVAARYSHISFHEVHRECGHRVQQQLYCSYDKRVVSRDEIVMGYEVDEDKMVIVDREELKKLQPASSSSMEILQFVKLSDVDPIFFETSYFSVPEEAGRRGYALLLKTMEDMKFAALAQVTMHQREHIVVIRAREQGMTLHTMFYQSEIREVAEFTHQDKVEPKEQEKKLAMQLIESLAATFEPEKYRDEYMESMRTMIAAKQKGQEVTPTTHPVRAPVIDLMDALRKSINAKPAASASKKPPVRSISSGSSASQATQSSRKSSKKAVG